MKPGGQFVVMGQGDALILKTITPPSLDEFFRLLAEVRTLAKKAKGKSGDVKASIKKARRA